MINLKISYFFSFCKISNENKHYFPFCIKIRAWIVNIQDESLNQNVWKSWIAPAMPVPIPIPAPMLFNPCLSVLEPFEEKFVVKYTQ
ncbi:hypothetical protein BpHYR1_017611 [Brachionus plicatilis]|uniref:Uncharacterized protein n=1 Tax=Brachionus plicatilis TaxID=10195 RepID=A0A3M7Q7Y6_BRAPC|nr:hypothetical protein BpHYR1_017611 [Brachionus plicatilis]